MLIFLNHSTLGFERIGLIMERSAHVRYENLQSFCFKCGMVGHVEQACAIEQVRSQENPSQPLYYAGVGPTRDVWPIMAIIGELGVILLWLSLHFFFSFGLSQFPIPTRGIHIDRLTIISSSHVLFLVN